ncbi:acetamidase [Candidatus Aerophobetes bacterium Ae_b3a]|nr:acetamidase/formamidase family protein [Candidatus Aerophobetes bacterium]TKJ47687.1 MAG: acetamidase [Candidatus Aerophobetes bacterium Ae_b3a]
MKRISRKEAMKYGFNRHDEPVLRVREGEVFAVETEDAFSGYLRSEDRLPIIEHLPVLKFNPPKGNPMAGPVYIEGARKGDLLVVNIKEIIPDKQGVTAFCGGRGPLGDSKKWEILSEPYTHILKHLPGPSGTTRDGRAVFNDKITWDLHPFIGTIGVAPEFEVETSVVGQGSWGGNLDSRDIKEGTKVYINCYHDGGLLYVGDVHGTQGDTEFYGAADETRAEVTLSCNVIKNKVIPFLRLEKKESIVSLYSYRPLEEAVERAIIYLMEWMVEEYGVSEREAYMHVCINPEFRVNIYQMVKLGRIQYTVGAEIPKKYLVAEYGSR